MARGGLINRAPTPYCDLHRRTTTALEWGLEETDSQIVMVKLIDSITKRNVQSLTEV